MENNLKFTHPKSFLLNILIIKVYSTEYISIYNIHFLDDNIFFLVWGHLRIYVTF